MEVTEAAKKELKEKLGANTDDMDVCIRLKTDAEGGLGLVLGHENESDIVVEHEDRKLLLVEQELATNLENAILDVEETKEGRRLFMRSK